MMLGFIVAQGKGVADDLVRETAMRLRDDGLALAGAVQVNTDTDPARKCEMDLHVLSGGDIVRISQNLGALASGCRLDPEGLARAVGLVEAALAEGADCLIVNKFGNQEATGGGFRPAIGAALSAGIPVLTAVNGDGLEAFHDFADGMAERLPDEVDEMVAWCKAQTAQT